MWFVEFYHGTPLQPQVCLAAERCGHLDFDARADVWWSSEGFHCGDDSGPDASDAAELVSFWDIYRKVGGGRC